MKQPVQVSIMNQSFSVETDTTEEHVTEVATYVDKKIKQIQKQTKKASSLHIALLTCLNIADEFRSYRLKNVERNQRAEKKLDNLLELVDLQI